MTASIMARVMAGISSVASRLRSAILDDWRGAQYMPYGAAVVLLASLVTLAYYHNQPTTPFDPDSPVYVTVSHKVAQGHFFDPVRTPGYPLLLALVWLITGKDNLAAASDLQGVLFVLAALGAYGLACAVVRRAWLAAAITLPVAASVLLVSYTIPILTEALALFLLTCVAVVLAWLVHRPDPRKLWLAMGLLFALGMTRPEWIYFGVPLVAFVLLVAWRRALLRRFAPHALATLLLFYGLSGFYVLVNATRHDIVGFGANQNVDLLGKVMQYQMLHEAPPQYAALTREVDAYMAQGDWDPWHIVAHDPSLLAHHYALAGTYGRTIMLHHPVEFVLDTVPVVFHSLPASDPHQGVVSGRPTAGLLQTLAGLGALFQYSLLLFPFVALGWWCRLVLLLRRRPLDELTALMCGLSLPALYGLAVTTLFVYTQYARMNVPYDTLMVVVVWGTVGAACVLLARWIVSTARRPAQYGGTSEHVVGNGSLAARESS